MKLLLFFELILLFYTSISCSKEIEEKVNVNVMLNDSINGILDIPYGNDPAQRFDIFYNNADSINNSGLFVYIHGGSWCFGDKNELEYSQIISLVELHYVVMRVNYRLAPYPLQLDNDRKVKNLDQCNDVLDAINYALQNSEYYQITNNAIVVAGHSAGAQITAFTVLNKVEHLKHDIESNLFKKIILLDAGGYLTNTEVFQNSFYYPYFINSTGNLPSEIEKCIPSNYLSDIYAKSIEYVIVYSNSPYRVTSNSYFIDVLKKNECSYRDLHIQSTDSHELILKCFRSIRTNNPIHRRVIRLE